MPAEIGILLVHGIGSQVRGDTLVNLGEPIFKKIKAWVESPAPNEHIVFDFVEETSAKQGGQVTLIDAHLSPLVNEPSQQAEPAHVRFSIVPKSGDAPVEWVMAECHWATSFPAPPPRKVTAWIMRVLPWVCISFVARRLRLAASATANSPYRWRELARLFASTLLLILAVPLIGIFVLLLQLSLIVLLVVDLVPLKIVQEAVTRINVAISAILGDCYIFASSEFRQQAVTAKLFRDLKWLESKFNCRSLVIIAHSQGAAVAYLTLKNFGVGKAKLLITFGAGIVKLFQLQSRQSKWWIDMLGLIVPTIGMAMLALAAGWFGYHSLPPKFLPYTFFFQVAATLVFLVLAVWAAWHEHTEEVRVQASEFARQGLKWIDLHASMDPVPNGPIFIPGSDDVHSVKIFNQSSLIADHTSYASNQEEFLLPIADAIVQHSGTDLKISPVLGSTRMLAKRIHRIRNTAKQIDNVFLLLALLAFLLNREAMEATGSFLIGWIDAGCDKGVGNCWRYSARVTGSGAALIVFLFFRLCVEGCHSIPVTMMKDLFRDFEPWVQWSLRSHAFACLILSFALALQYPHTFGWIGWAYGLVPDVYLPRSSLIAPSPWSVQATVFGIVGAIALYGFDSIRVSRLLKSWRHAREAEAKVMAAKK